MADEDKPPAVRELELLRRRKVGEWKSADREAQKYQRKVEFYQDRAAQLDGDIMDIDRALRALSYPNE